jgi:hypothetical protein
MRRKGVIINMASRKLVAVVVGVLLVGGTLTGGVVAAQHREVLSPEELDASLQNEPLVRVADITADRGLPARGVFIQQSEAGLLCLWDAPSATSPARQGGCNPADDPLGGKKVMASFAYEGGPVVGDVKDARLIGLAAPDASAVEVIMSDGTHRKLKLHKASAAALLAFGHRFNRGEIRRGVTPTAVVASNDAGVEIGRQATGF